MLLFNILQNPIILIGFTTGLLLAITIHESAHAWMAYKLGDPTAKYEGRISLNPLRHLDPIGTIMLLVAGFGWGKPVSVNPYNLKSKWDEVRISLAGPISNLLLAIVLSLFIRFLNLPTLIDVIFLYIIQINLTLMLFNLLPIPPLDGSSILKALTSDEVYETINNLSFPLLIAFLVFMYSTPIVSNFFSQFINNFISIFTGMPIN